MKIRVILIVCFICVRNFLPAQAIKNNALYFLSSVFVENKKNTLCADKGHIVFDTENNSAACFTSCNFIKLQFSSEKNDLKFTGIIPGKEPCPDPLISLEEDFKNLLPKVTSFKTVGKQLVLMNSRDTLMVFYEKEISKK